MTCEYLTISKKNGDFICERDTVLPSGAHAWEYCTTSRCRECDVYNLAKIRRERENKPNALEVMALETTQ